MQLIPRLVRLACPLLVALLAGCATTAPAYRWADYESQLYGYYQGQDRGERLGAALQELIARAEARGQPVAPGLYAEYGYLLYRRGQADAAIDMYRHELARWPESRQMVERLAADAGALIGPTATEAPADTASSAQPAARRLHSIVVLPVNGAGVPATASDLFLASVLRPLAARGYYVFPVNVVRAVLAGEGYDRAQQSRGIEPRVFRQLFGADAVLLLRVQTFEAGARPGSPAFSAELDYELRDARSGERLWGSHRQVDYVAPQGAGGGLSSAFDERVDAKLFRLAPQYISLARGTSEFAMLDPADGLPAGPYAGSMGWLLSER